MRGYRGKKNPTQQSWAGIKLERTLQNALNIFDATLGEVQNSTVIGRMCYNK